MRFNRLLDRQIRRHFGEVDTIPPELIPLFEHISDSYNRQELDRELIERTLDINSKELLEAYDELRDERNALKSSQLALVAAKERAEEMNRLKSAFLANMSHEIRTPMTAILGFADYLLEEKELDEEVRECMETISRSGERLLGTINGIIDLSRIESDTIEVELKAVSLLPEIERISKLLAPLATKKGSNIAVECESDLTTFTDPQCFYQILTNIVGNAVKFSDTGTIWIRASKIDVADRVLIQIEDSGVGISEEFLPHIFDKFKQESDGLARTHEGTGLGLTISKALVERIGGNITVESSRGRGSKFNVFLPISGPVKPEAESWGKAQGTDGKSNARLLVVEDTPDTKNFLRLALRRKFNVELVSTAAEGLQACANERFDLIIMDVNLGPGPSGLDVTKLLREKGPNMLTPILALTANAMVGNREQTLEAGCSEYLAKPFAVKELLRVIHVLLQPAKLS